MRVSEDAIPPPPPFGEVVEAYRARQTVEPDTLIIDELGDAVEIYCRRFGTAPGVWEFMGHQEALIREILAAVARGEPLTGDETYRRLGMTPPPHRVLL